MAIANLSPTRRTWLELAGFLIVQHANNTGRIGEWARPTSGSTGEGNETLLVFDVSSIPSGSIINSVNLDMVCNTQGTQSTQTGTAYLAEQDLTAPASWTVPDPKYNDFNPAGVWAATLQSIPVMFTGNYNFPTSAAFVQLVQDWIDGVKDPAWGMIIETVWDFLSHWLDVDSVTLNIDYTPPLALGHAHSKVNNNGRLKSFVRNSRATVTAPPA
jgi:hypothetical protein